MSTRLNRRAYEELIAQDIDRVKSEMPSSLERSHIIDVLRASPDREYGPEADKQPQPVGELDSIAGEPVAWMTVVRGELAYLDSWDDGTKARELAAELGGKAIPLYTRPASDSPLREHLENALSWAHRLDGAEQDMMQGGADKFHAIKVKAEVLKEMKAARAALAPEES